MPNSNEPDDTIPRPGDQSEEAPDQSQHTDQDSWTASSYPLVDSDFVGDTLDRVLSDRDEIENEAALVDAIRFEYGDLQNYAAPEASADFVDTTLARVLAQRGTDLHLRTADDEEFQALIENAVVPEPSAEFVERTLSTVMADYAAARVHSPRFGNRFSLAASIAALVLCAVAIFWNTRTATEIADSITFTAPVGWAALVTEDESAASETRLVVPFTPEHQMQVFAFETLGDDK